MPFTEGQVFGKDASDFGTFTFEGNTVKGEAKKVTGFDQFSDNPDEQEGFYLPVLADPWEGVQFRSGRLPERWVTLKDDGKIVIFLGKDAPDQTPWYELKDADGLVMRYTVDVSAAAAMAVAASVNEKPVMNYQGMKKAELVALAAERQVELPDNATKAQIIEVLEEQ